jgi:hypothetical protein
MADIVAKDAVKDVVMRVREHVRRRADPRIAPAVIGEIAARMARVIAGEIAAGRARMVGIIAWEFAVSGPYGQFWMGLMNYPS